MPEPQVLDRLDHYLAILHKRRGLLAACAGGALLVAALHNLTARPQYEAVAQILFDPTSPDVLSGEQVQDSQGTDGEEDHTQLQLLGSRTLAEKVLARLGRRADAEFGGGSPAARIDVLRSRLSIEPLRESRLVNLRFRAHDPELAAQAANLLARLYVEQWLEFRSAAFREAAARLEEVGRNEAGRLAATEEALQRFREQERLLGPDGRQGEAGLAGLTAALMATRIERISKQTLYRRMEGRSAAELETFPPVLAAASVQTVKAELAGLEAEQARLGETLGDRHPRMVDLRARITAALEQARAEVRTIVEVAKKDAETAAAREAGLARELEAARHAALLRQRKALRLRVLQQEVESRRELLQELRRRRLETGLASRLQATNLRIMEEAEAPRSPVLPRTWRNYRLAVVLSLGFGIFLCVLFERLDNSVRTPEHVAEMELPFLGFVPRVSVEGPPDRPQPLVVGDPHAAAAEAYRVVRTNLISAANGGGRIILVSSSSPEEGKTTTAANLAASLALNGSRVLAVDADLRRPALHGHFGFAPGPGLSDVLGGRCRARTAIRPTRLRGLQVLPSGPLPPNPAELLGSPGLRKLLAAQRKRYHWIVIDAPPILAMADAPVLCTLADGLVLVVWAENTSRAAVQRAVEQVAQVGGKLRGVVLNMVDLERNAYYYRQRYSEYYYKYYTVSPATAAAASA